MTPDIIYWFSAAFEDHGQVKRGTVWGMRPQDSASVLAYSPSLRRRDMDIILIFSSFWDGGQFRAFARKISL